MCVTLILATTLALLPAALPPDTFTIHPVLGTGEFTSPAEALASPLVADGDLLLVMPGTYVGTLVVDKVVELVSTDGAKLTILDGAGSGPVLDITAGATVRGFTITGGGGFVSYGGVHIDSAVTVFLEDNRIIGNHPFGDVGLPAGGVGVEPFSSAVLSGNDIRSNTSLSTGGVMTGPSSTVDMIGNRIRGNGGFGTTIGGILWGASGRLVNNQITGNYGTGVGGLYIAGGIGPPPSGAIIDVVNCTIFGNYGASGLGSVGGVFLDDGGAVTIRNTIVFSNFRTPGGDMEVSPDFTAPPAAGFLDLDYSHVGTTGFGIIPGMHMVPFFLFPEPKAPAGADLSGPTAYGDFRLKSSSPDVDTGDATAFPVDLLPIDLRGRPRFFGPRIDLGAFETGAGRLRKL
jgi:hypothetical protein